MKNEGELVLSWEDGILVADYQMKTLDLDLDMAKAIVEKRLKFTGGEECVLLIKNQNLTSMSKDARDYLGSSEGVLGLIAIAILTETILKEFLINFFLRVSRPPFPTRMFKDESKAKAWLKTLQK